MPSDVPFAHNVSPINIKNILKYLCMFMDLYFIILLTTFYTFL